MAGDRNDVDALQPVLDRLAPALEILDGFHHRNKNQHRLSKWWAQLDMLRRATRKLALDLQASIRDRPPPLSQAAKRRKKLKAAAGGGGADERLGLRAGYLRGQLVPRAYLAFTQLAADNQYAQLGLALLGVLAQVDQAASSLAPAARETAAAAAATATGSSTAAHSAVGPGDVAVVVAAGRRVRPPGASEETTDVGVAVSRTDVARGVDAESSLSTGGAHQGAEGGRDPLMPPPRNTRLGEDRRHETADREGKGASPQPGKRKGDEFDQLFGPLQPKSSSKKKKRKKRDEFDDLFSSLL
ncbi:hypothetical protein QBC33DRAFT_532918 [Phialemonium atrogriseum]|uniref:RNase MRP protein 1 RNA binding domain-containing protein n=1 Tax=Phialemonium atrogriseum TaxID=1093897 RepID=A0AAJ0FIX3_9PEZI|nr:uncharacterized protein QBC33DRAFT_532918 [Phialemonium atrogriseum]KAK1769302.1 hypothetical protein QBC33DRAFT_532918 [Phialemonium atrogriseum]